MAGKFVDSAEYRFGDNAQRAWGDILASRGNCVLPVYDMNNNVAETKAPMLLTIAGVKVAPDLLVFTEKNGTVWQEVKAKSQPSWRICPPGPRWEHGCDWALAAEYMEVESRTDSPVYIVVYEQKSPINSNKESPLEGPERWLLISVALAWRIGQHRPIWPGKKEEPHRRGRNGQGGLLWDRSHMTDAFTKKKVYEESLT